jgi:hypothetical protein
LIPIEFGVTPEQAGRFFQTGSRGSP